MKRISYLSARILHRCKKDKTRLFPGKYLYATSSNEYGFKRGTLVKVSQLLKTTNWRGDQAGFVEAPFIEEVRDAIKTKLQIEIFPVPNISEGRLKYRVGFIDLVNLISDISDEEYYDYEDALEHGCVKMIREYKGINLGEDSFKE